MEWISANDPRIAVHGLPFHAENNGCFSRLPLRAEAVVRPQVFQLAKQPSGGRVRFRSNTTSLTVRVAHTYISGWDSMSVVGQNGLDLYVGPLGQEVCWGTTQPGGRNNAYEYTFFTAQAPEEREYTLYLPVYNDLTKLEIGLSDGATLLPPVSTYAVPKPVVFYGSSITQSGCASRPGNGYVPIVGRRLNVDVVNLGMSGHGHGEPEMAHLMAEIDASCYVLDFHCNVDSLEELRRVYEPFYRILRERRPDTPILMISMLATTAEQHNPWEKTKRLGHRETIRATVEKARREGDTRVWYLEGADLIGPATEGAYGDGIHPNDYGFVLMANGVTPVLRQILGL